MAEAVEAVPDHWDWKNPNYTPIFKERAERLAKLRTDPKLLAAAKIHYRYNAADFISDWGMTFDARNVDLGIPANVPFILFERQIEYVEWLEWMWRNRERGQCEKSRECGVSWLTISWACTKWCFEPGFIAGFGSRKADYVDKIGDPKSLFFMARHFLNNLPADFLPEGYDARVHNAHMRIVNPASGAALTGEAGDNIGRGGRTSVYFVDEAAFVEHQDLVEAALSMTTNCQIDISSWNGPGNLFFRKNQRLKGTDKLFVFDWRQDLRKDDAWYQKKKEEFDELIVAQEIDRDPYASQEDSFIPAKWVAAALDAHEVLGFDASGIRVTGFDPADVGDAKGVVNRHGSVLKQAEALRDGDITQAIPWAFSIADEFRADVLAYDGDGMGAPTMRLALQHRASEAMRIEAYHGSGSVEDPKEKYGKTDEDGRTADDLKTNDETFANYRAQAWTMLRDRFHKTWQAVERAKKGQLVNADPEELISIDTKTCKAWPQLQAELSSAKRIFTPNGKIAVEAKAKMRARGVQSPNLADATVIAYSRRKPQPQRRRGYRGMKTHQFRDSGTGY